jgi:hypothetical protein
MGIVRFPDPETISLLPDLRYGSGKGGALCRD